MESMKRLGRQLALGGGALIVVMLITLYLSFSRLPGDTSHGPLAEALGPWILLGIVGLLTALTGLVLWFTGFVMERIRK